MFFLRGAAATQHVPRLWPTVPAFSPSYYVTETITHYAPQLLHGTSLAEKDYSLVTANKNKYYSKLGL